jgi:alkylhydroperoxidase family enzyme
MNAAFETGRWALEPGLRKLVHLRVAQIVGCVF